MPTADTLSPEDAALCERLRRPWAEGETIDRVGDAVAAAMRIEALSAEVARLKAQTVGIPLVEMDKGGRFPE